MGGKETNRKRKKSGKRAKKEQDTKGNRKPQNIKMLKEKQNGHKAYRAGWNFIQTSFVLYLKADRYKK